MNRATKNDSWVQNPDGTPGYTENLITGCLNGCPHCFAEKLANGRLRQRYLPNPNVAKISDIKNFPPTHKIPFNALQNPFYPRFWPERLEELNYFLTRSKEPVGVFLNIMGEWAGEWVPREWQEAQFELINWHLRHWFYLLTHRPQNLPRFSPFPGNCRVGVTATNYEATEKALHYLFEIEARIKFISFEPLLGEIIKDKYFPAGLPCEWERINWLIIGALTGTRKDIFDLYHFKGYNHLTPMPWGKRWTLQPKVEWVEEIVRAADKAGIPVFLKNNLYPLFGVETQEQASNLHRDYPWAFRETKFAGENEKVSYKGKVTVMRQEMPG